MFFFKIERVQRLASCSSIIVRTLLHAKAVVFSRVFLGFSMVLPGTAGAFQPQAER